MTLTWLYNVWKITENQWARENNLFLCFRIYNEIVNSNPLRNSGCTRDWTRCILLSDRLKNFAKDWSLCRMSAGHSRAINDVNPRPEKWPEVQSKRSLYKHKLPYVYSVWLLRNPVSLTCSSGIRNIISYSYYEYFKYGWVIKFNINKIYVMIHNI